MVQSLGILMTFDTQAGGGVYANGGAERQSNKLGPHVTIFQAECHSIKHGAQWLNKDPHKIAGRNIAIFTDTKSLLQALAKPYAKSRMVYQTICLLRSVAGKCSNLYIRWVKAHNGVVSNENADHLAVTASKSDGP